MLTTMRIHFCVQYMCDQVLYPHTSKGVIQRCKILTSFATKVLTQCMRRMSANDIWILCFGILITIAIHICFYIACI